MLKVTDRKAVLLTHAAAHGDGQPLPDGTAEPACTIAAISHLVRRGLMEKSDVNLEVMRHRKAGNRCYDVFIAAGLVAIGVEEPAGQNVGKPAAAPATAPNAGAEPASATGAPRRTEGRL